MPKGKTLKTYLPFEVTNAVLCQVLLHYRYLSVSTLYVALCDEFRTTHCVYMRLNIGHWPCLSDKELVNSSPVIDTETWGAISCDNHTYRQRLCARVLLDNAN